MEGKHDEPTIDTSEFFKSLGKLEALAKGDATEEDVEKSQLFHTSGNSKRGTWPGGDTKKIGNKWDDSIGSDGTDYKAARKAIAEKVMKGEALSPTDIEILKSDQVEKGDDVDKGEGQEAVNKGKGEDEEKYGKDKACKSLTEGNEQLTKAIEMSPFLSEFAKAFDERLNMLEERNNDQVVKAVNAMLESLGEYLEPKFSKQGEFNKSLAEVVSGIGHGLSTNIQQTAEMAQAPVAAPKSTLRAIPGGVKPLEKSFEGGGEGNDTLTKSQVLGAMSDMVEKGSLNPLEVIKYENTDQIRPDLLSHISQTLTAAG
jgi:hypothetical protein